MDNTRPNRSSVPKKLHLPLFLICRNRIRLNRFLEIRNYVVKKAKSYATCIREKTEDEGNEKNCQYAQRPANISKRPTITKHKSSIEKDRKMAPNRYNVSTTRSNRMGMKGAYWSRLKRDSVGNHRNIQNAATIYEVSRDSEGLQKNVSSGWAGLVVLVENRPENKWIHVKCDCQESFNELKTVNSLPPLQRQMIIVLSTAHRLTHRLANSRGLHDCIPPGVTHCPPIEKVHCLHAPHLIT